MDHMLLSQHWCVHYIMRARSISQHFLGVTKDNISCQPWILDKLITTYYDVGALREHLIRGFLLN